MGDCKDNMKPTTQDTKKFGLFKSKKNDNSSSAKTELTFADVINNADEILGKLITKKEIELNTERGQEEKNKKALAMLRCMAWHLDQIVEVAVDYSKGG